MSLSRLAIIMVDLETLGKGPDAVVTQAAFKAVYADDPDETVAFESYYLPIEPQTELGRRMDPETVVWWMNQEDKARRKFDKNIGGDVHTLISMVNSFIRDIQVVIDDADDYEIWARGPQFDVVILESLFESVATKAPWSYRNVRDLRTLMAITSVKSENVKSDDIVKHVALEDCRFQIRCWEAAIKVLRGDTEDESLTLPALKSV